MLIALAIPKILSFFLTPFYWSKLSTSEYSVISSFFLIQEVTFIFFTFGLESVIQRYFYDWSSEERRIKIGSIWTFTIFFSIIVCLIIFIVFYLLIQFSLFDFIDPVYLMIGLGFSFFSSFSLIPVTIFRVSQSKKKFIFSQYFSFLLTNCILVVALNYYNNKLQGFLYARLLGEGLVALFWFIYMLYFYGFFKLTFLKKEFFVFTYPNVFVSFINSISFSVDRIMLERFSSSSFLGAYYIGKNFTNNLSFFSQSLKIAFTPYVYKLVSVKSDRSKEMKANSVGVLGVITFFILALFTYAFSLFSPNIIFLLNSEYSVVSENIPFFCLAFLINNADSFLARGTDIVKRNEVNIFISIFLLVVSFPIYYFSLKLYSYWGSIISLIFISTLGALIKIVVANFYYQRPLYLLLIFYVVGFPILFYFFFNNILLSHLTKFLLIKLIFLALYFFIGVYLLKKRLTFQF